MERVRRPNVPRSVRASLLRSPDGLDLSGAVCEDCAGEVDRKYPRAQGTPKTCTACQKRRAKAHVARWKAEHPDRAKTHYAKYAASPKHKRVRAAWLDRNRDKTRTYSRRSNARRRADQAPRVVCCVVLLCRNTFITAAKNRNRRLCDECRAASRSYYQTISAHRAKRRVA